MKKIILDCYTSRPEVYKYAKISKSNNFLPNWWKELPSSSCPVVGKTISNNTMKSCPGFTDFFKNSYTIPLWSDLKLETNAEGGWAWQYSDEVSEVIVHDEEQHNGFMPDSQHFKLITPWRLVCNKPIQWVFMAPSWHPIKGVHILSGVVDFYYQHTASINIFVDRPADIVIPLHTPLIHLIPMTEQKVEIQSHLVSDKEYKQLFTPTLTFNKWYYKMRRLINEHSK